MPVQNLLTMAPHGLVGARDTSAVSTYVPEPRVSSRPVLLFDGRSETRELCRTALLCAGYPVIEADTERDALRIVYQHAPRAALVELPDPGCSLGMFAGFFFRDEAARAIPVLVLGAAMQPDAGADRPGRNVFVRPPYTPQGLLAAVQHLITPALHRYDPVMQPSQENASSARTRSSAETRFCDPRMRQTWGVPAGVSSASAAGPRFAWTVAR